MEYLITSKIFATFTKIFLIFQFLIFFFKKIGVLVLLLIFFFFGSTSFRPCECMLKRNFKTVIYTKFQKGRGFLECWAIINLKYNNKKRSLSFKSIFKQHVFSTHT